MNGITHFGNWVIHYNRTERMWMASNTLEQSRRFGSKAEAIEWISQVERTQ